MLSSKIVSLLRSKDILWAVVEFLEPVEELLLSRAFPLSLFFWKVTCEGELMTRIRHLSTKTKLLSLATLHKPTIFPVNYKAKWMLESLFLPVEEGKIQLPQTLEFHYIFLPISHRIPWCEEKRKCPTTFLPPEVLKAAEGFMVNVKLLGDNGIRLQHLLLQMFCKNIFSKSVYYPLKKVVFSMYWLFQNMGYRQADCLYVLQNMKLETSEDKDSWGLQYSLFQRELSDIWQYNLLMLSHGTIRASTLFQDGSLPVALSSWKDAKSGFLPLEEVTFKNDDFRQMIESEGLGLWVEQVLTKTKFIDPYQVAYSLGSSSWCSETLLGTYAFLKGKFPHLVDDVRIVTQNPLPDLVVQILCETNYAQNRFASCWIHPDCEDMFAFIHDIPDFFVMQLLPHLMTRWMEDGSCKKDRAKEIVGRVSRIPHMDCKSTVDTEAIEEWLSSLPKIRGDTDELALRLLQERNFSAFLLLIHLHDLYANK